MEKLRFLTPIKVREIASEFGTPLYVYDESSIRARAAEAMSFPNAFGITARFAIKACPNATILRIMDSCGMHFDASSSYEAKRAIIAGIAPSKILLTAQEFTKNLDELLKKGVLFTCCSLHQLKAYGIQFPGTEVSVRFNPGLGSGATKRTNVGGPAASFGIWHEYLDEVKKILSEHSLRLVRIHSHIGAGTDPDVWKKVAELNLSIAKEFPEVSIMNLGGGFKVGRMADEKSSKLSDVGAPVAEAFKSFFENSGRKLHLEIEPGTFMTALAGSIISEIDDIVDTGQSGYLFYKTNSGMNDLLRPSIYGAQHPLIVVPKKEQSNSSRHTVKALVVGHCCESGDILTPAPGDPEALGPRELLKAEIGDFLVIEATGAYGSGFSSKNYNSFPDSPEVLLRKNGGTILIRKRQELSQIIENEIMSECF